MTDNDTEHADGSPEDESCSDQLESRVDELESRLDELMSADDGVEDEQGRKWSAGTLMQLGLSRREAVTALGLLAGGVTLREAFVRAVGVASADTNPDAKDVGTPSDPADVYASNVYGPEGDVNFEDPVSIGDLDIGDADYLSEGDFVGFVTYGNVAQRSLSTTSQSYTADENWLAWRLFDFADFVSADVTTAIRTELDVVDTQDIRLRNTSDSETVFERTGDGSNIGRVDTYSPSTPNNFNLRIEIRSPDGTEVTCRTGRITVGVQL